MSDETEVHKAIQTQKQAEALIFLAEGYIKEKPEVMVPHVSLLIVAEAYKYLKNENHALRIQVQNFEKNLISK